MWIILSLSIIFALNNIIPNNKMRIISKIGSNTLNIYLIHGIIIKLIEPYKNSIFTDNEIVNILICLMISTILVVIFSNNFVKKPK